MPTIRELAKQAYDAMESDTRGTGQTFYKFKSDRPEWMLELEQAAHSSFPADDHRFRMIYDALAAICEDASEDDTLDSLRKRGLEWADTDISSYADYFRQWFASNPARARYVDEAAEKLWPKRGIIQVLARGELRERQEVYSQVLEFLARMAGEPKAGQ
jgi:hypothetical protein